MNQRGSESCGGTRLLVSDLRIEHHQHIIAFSLSRGSRYHHKDKKRLVVGRHLIEMEAFTELNAVYKMAQLMAKASVLSVLCVL